MTDFQTQLTLEAERAVLAGLMVDATGFEDVAAVLHDGHWFRLAHRFLWRAMTAAAANGQSFEPAVLRQWLSAVELDEITPAYLYGLVDDRPRRSNLLHFAGRVREFATRRAVAEAARQLLADLDDSQMASGTALERAESALQGLRQGEVGRGLSFAPERAAAVLDQIEAGPPPRTPTGMSQLDGLLGGFEPGQLIIVGARPSMGKTALGLGLAMAAGKQGPVLFCSLEMSQAQMDRRELIARSGVPGWKLERLRTMTDQATGGMVAAAVDSIANGQIAIYDRAALTVGQLRVAIRATRNRYDRLPALVLVDYLQLMRGETNGPQDRDRQQEVARISGGLKQLARDLSVPILALSQLSRQSEQRANKQPVLADLRESGALEQDADIVALLHREQFGAPEDDGRARLIVAKNRNGATGVVDLHFEPERMQFTESTRVFA